MANDIRVRIIGDDASFKAALKSSAAGAKGFEGQMARIGASTEKLGKSFTRSVSLPLAGIGVASVKMAQNFDLLISRLQGLAGVSAKQAKDWREQILKLAPVVGKAPAELANGLYQIASAGVKGKRAFEALTVSAKASAAGLGDTATVADAITSAMNAYAKSGLTAKQAADVLTSAVRDGKGEASAFAPVLGKVVAVASQLGVPFDQAAAALAQMTKLGVPADDAATQLSATFSGLLKTTPRAEKALEAMGLSSAGLRQELREKGLLATLQTLNEKAKGSSVAMAEAFPNVRALRGILQLVGTAAQGTAQVFHDTKNSTKSLGTAFDAASKTDAFKMQQALASLKTAAIQLGQTLAPVARKIAEDVTKISNAYQKLSPHQKAVIDKLGEVAIVAGPAIVAFGKIEKAVANLAKAYKTLAAMEGLASGGLVALAAAGAAYAIYKGVTAGDSATYGAPQQYSTDGKGNYYRIVPSRAGGATKVAVSSGEYYAATGKTAPTNTGGADRSNHPGVQGAGSGMMWSGDYTGLKSSFKSKLEQCVAAAGGTSINVTSGRRSGSQNTSVGGAGNSNHLTGSAADGTCRINGHDYPLGAAPINYGSFGLRAGSTFDWGGAPDIYHVDDGSNVGGVSGSSGSAGTSNYDPLAGSKKAKAPPWKGLTQSSLTTLTGSINATLRGTAGSSDPVIQNARKHIKAIEDSLRLHMPASETAKDKVELKKWGKVLKDEVTKNAKAAAAAAAAAKQQFQRALSLDVTNVLRQFDREFAQVRSKFDKETQKGLAGFVVAQTPEEKALADFLAQRQAQANADQMSQAQSDLSAAIATGDPTQIKQAQDAISQLLLDGQQAALEQAAQDSRTAADAKTSDQQQAYQDQRDLQWQSLQDINDDQRTALQNSLDDWTANLEAKKQSWSQFIKWLGDNGYSTVGLINPAGSGQTVGGITLPTSGIIGHGFGGSFANGGVVPGILGEPKMILAHGGETVIPHGRGGGGVTVNVYGWVGSDQQIAQKIQDALGSIGRRNPNIFAGRA